MIERATRHIEARSRYLESDCVGAHLRPFLGWILDRHHALGGVTEIRIIGSGQRRGVWSVFVGPENRQWLIEALAPISDVPRAHIPAGDHPRVGEANIYFSLQAIQPQLQPQGPPVIRRARTTAKDTDVVAYTLFAVDVDPVRHPSGRSATNDEKGAAMAVVLQVRTWFEQRGIQSMLADSGNGYHLLVPLVPALGDEVRQTAVDAKQLLRLLHAHFSTPTAKVDTSIFNPSRIFKLYGTKAVKGEDTLETPHRFATIDLSVIPEDVDLFSRLAEEFNGGGEVVPDPEMPARPARPPAAPPPKNEISWERWRADALATLPLDQVYGDLLTGRPGAKGWLQCRDPDSPSGDQHPSAGVADGSGEAQRGAFHSFRTGQTISVFDFLVKRGDATSFREACVRVAELSGIPFPAREAPQSRADKLVARFQQRWREAANDGERARLVRKAVALAVPLPAIEQQSALKEIRRIAGISRGVFRATVAEVRRAARDRRQQQIDPPSPRANRPTVDYVQNRDTIEDLFQALTSTIRPADRFFRTDRELIFVHRGLGPISVHERNVSGLLAALVELRFFAANEGRLNFQRFDVLPFPLARAFVGNPAVFAWLPRLRTYARSPIFDIDWNFVGEPGYHAESGIFYDGPKVEPCTGAERLSGALKDFHFKGGADLVAIVGALLTAVTMPHWGRGHPFLAINGNKPGVGKSTLARLIGAIVEGTEPHTVSYVPDEAEFEKQLATRVEAGDRVIVIDNAKTRRAIESASLERCITDSRLSFRRLGSNTSITREANDVLFCLTMNLTQMGPDLRRRALPVNLELVANVRSVRYPIDDLVGAVLEHRLAILGELAGMVTTWLEAGRPDCENPARHSTGQRWAATIDAILRLSGFDGFLSNFDESEHAFDARYALMLEIVTDHHDTPPSTAAQWADSLKDGPMEDRFKDRRGNLKSARSRSTIVGGLFSDYLDITFDVNNRSYELVREKPTGAGHAPATYFFHEVQS